MAFAKKLPMCLAIDVMLIKEFVGGVNTKIEQLS